MDRFVNLTRQVFISLFGISSLIFTFQGKPFALISYIGFLLVMIGCSSIFGPLLHKNRASGSQRLAIIVLGFAIAILGSSMVTWGGLVSITAFNTVTFDYVMTGMIIGIPAGLFNIDNKIMKTND